LGVERLAEILVGGFELAIDAKQRHQVLRTTTLEIDDVGFVIANVAEQLVPDRPFAIESPALQGF
jgi:hypothetical protein